MFPVIPVPSPVSIPHPPLRIKLLPPWAAHRVVYARNLVCCCGTLNPIMGNLWGIDEL